MLRVNVLANQSWERLYHVILSLRRWAWTVSPKPLKWSHLLRAITHMAKYVTCSQNSPSWLTFALVSPPAHFGIANLKRHYANVVHEYRSQTSSL